MKTIDTKSLLLGIIACLLTVALTSNKAINDDDNNDSIEFVSSPAGLGIYNKEKKALYMYKMWNGNLNPTPHVVFKVSDDGSSLSELK